MLNDQPQFPASSAFVSCDWGTSALRLRWVDSAGAILGEVRRPHGCKAIFEEAQARAVPASVLYEQHLRGALTELARFRGSATQIPLVVSGMASSTIGWRELPYLEGPLALDGRNLRFEEISWDGPAWLGGTFLISGVAIRPEMMRGEETEAIGLLAGQPGFEGTLLLPGTHSKHLGVRDESVGSIATFMTGELFEVLALHSILKATVARIEVAGADFEGGVRHAAEHGLAASLFRVRTGAVLDGIEPSANAAFLSGLLIGDELAALLARKPGSIIVAGAPQLRELYLRALAVLSFERVLALSEEHLALAVPRAHALFLAGRSGA